MHRLEDFAPSAARSLPLRLRSTLQLHRLGTIRTITITRLDTIPIIIGNRPPLARANASPANTASPSNLHRRQPSTGGGPRVPSWGAFGRRPLGARSNSHEGRHPKPFTGADIWSLSPRSHLAAPRPSDSRQGSGNDGHSLEAFPTQLTPENAKLHHRGPKKPRM